MIIFKGQGIKGELEKLCLLFKTLRETVRLIFPRQMQESRRPVIGPICTWDGFGFFRCK